MCNLHPISVITPCFNAASTIAQTIESVIGQVVSMPVRYHVQDGLSTDGTQDVLTRYQKRIAENPDRYGHISFSWRSEPDANMYDAIAKGVALLDIPSDAFMGWINADDILLPGALETVAHVAGAFPNVRWIGGTWTKIDIHGAVLSQFQNQFYPQEFLRAGICDGMHWPVIQQEGTFWRKSLWDEAGGIDTSFRLAGDWDLWRRMAVHAPYTHITQAMGAIRSHPGQLSATPGAYMKEIDAALPLHQRQKKGLRAWKRLCFPGGGKPLAPVLVKSQDGYTLIEHHAHFYKREVRLLMASLGLLGAIKVYEAIKRHM